MSWIVLVECIGSMMIYDDLCIFSSFFLVFVCLIVTCTFSWGTGGSWPLESWTTQVLEQSWLCGMLGQVGADADAGLLRTIVATPSIEHHKSDLLICWSGGFLTRPPVLSSRLECLWFNHILSNSWQHWTIVIHFTCCKIHRAGRLNRLQADLPDSRGRTALHVAARKGLSEHSSALEWRRCGSRLMETRDDKLEIRKHLGDEIHRNYKLTFKTWATWATWATSVRIWSL